MGKIYAALLMGAAMVGAAGAASAQDYSQLPDRALGRATEAMPALGAPAAPDGGIAIPSGARTAQTDRPAGAMTSPVRPGSGVALAFEVPAGLSVSISTAAAGRDQQAFPGGYSVASPAERESVPPMLGVDLTTPGLSALPPGGAGAPPAVKLGQ